MSTISFLSLVVQADPDFYRERQHPEVYLFDKPKKDAGDNAGPYGTLERKFIRVTASGARRVTQSGGTRVVVLP